LPVRRKGSRLDPAFFRQSPHQSQNSNQTQFPARTVPPGPGIHPQWQARPTNSKPNPIFRPAEMACTAAPSPKFKTKPNFPHDVASGRHAQKSKPNPIPRLPADGIVEIRRSVKPSLFVWAGRDGWMQPGHFGLPRKAGHNISKKNSPTPEVPRFERTGPDPPLRSPPGGAPAAPRS
jgi:hypothetical protein